MEGVKADFTQKPAGIAHIRPVLPCFSPGQRLKPASSHTQGCGLIRSFGPS